MADSKRPEGAPPGKQPSGEGWDDGRGGRARRRTSSSGRGRPTDRSGDAAAPKRRKPPAERSGILAKLPRWALPVGAAAVVVLLLLVVVVTRGGGGASGGGPCLGELAKNLPQSSKIVYGSDLVQARKAGYVDDGSLEDLGDSQRKTGTIPDALTQQFRYARLVSAEDFKARTGVASKDIECSLSALDRTVMTGAFDTAEVDGSSAADDGRLAASDDHLALVTDSKTDPKRLLEPRDDDGLAANQDVVAVIESLRTNGSYTILVEAGTDLVESKPRAAGFGVAEGQDGDRALVVAWKFGSDDAAAAGRSQVVERVNDTLRGTTSISADDLEVDGSLVWAVISSRKAPDLLTTVLTRQRLLIPDG